MKKINPRSLFLIDALGALLSTLLLGLVLPRFSPVLGMPVGALYVLAFIAGVFFMYSLTCYAAKIKNWRPYLKLIAVSNLLYCGLTMGYLFYLRADITAWGVLYFVLEIIVITVLAVVEWKIAADSDLS